MPNIALFISLDVLRYKIEKTLNQFGIVDIQTIGANMFSMTSKNFVYPDVQLIIVDSDSPDFDAFTILANLKKGKKSADLPIIVIGNRTEKAFIQRLMTLGCTDYINKPLDDLTFASKVLQVIRECAHTKETTVKTVTELQQEDVKLKWNAAFETGIEAIDKDHRDIIENYEKLYQLMKDGQGHGFYAELLTFLADYITTHFESEEQFQLSIGYNQYDAHKKRHDFFKEKITAFMQDKPEPVSNYDLIKLNLFVKDWLIQHIFIEDKKIGTFYNNKNTISR